MYDPKCEDLAEHFLGERAPAKHREDLAQAIQDCIEDWINAALAVPAKTQEGNDD
jgi:hypothetical protein